MKKRIFAGLIAIAMAVSAIPNVFADGQTAEEITQYDKVEAENNCSTAIDGTTLSDDNSPDGTKYLKTTSSVVMCALSANTEEEYMWEADVRFDEDKSGISITALNGANGVRILRDDSRSGYICRWRNSRETRSTAVKLDDTTAWYHIQIIGHHNAEAYTAQLIRVTKWDAEKSEWVWVGEDNAVSPVSATSVARLVADANTSIDNARIVKLGADKLTVSTSPAGVTELSAGSSVQMSFKATRNNRDIAAPTVEWKVFEKNGAEINDGDISIDANGKVTASKRCEEKTVTVKAVSTVNEKELVGEYDIKINKVDWTGKKYDTLSLNAGDEVRAGSSLALTVTAKMDGINVTDLADSDVEWKIYDETYTQEIENKNIYVENGALVVDEKVISQKINLLAQDADGDVKSNILPITIKAKSGDAVDVGDSGSGDEIVFTDAGEDVSNANITSGSWDDSHYYYIPEFTRLNSVGALTQDIVIQADIQFKEENSGIALGNSGTDLKVGGQILRQGNRIGKVGSGNKFTGFTDANAESWYHVEIIARCAGSGSAYYAKAYVYEYVDGERVNPDNHESDKPAEGSLDLRTIQTSSKIFDHIEVNAGTGIDNIRIMKLVPDQINLTLSADTIFAGAKATATCAVLRRGVEIPSYPSDKILWGSDDRDNVKITNGEIETDALMDEKTVTIYAVLDGNSTVRGTAELNIIGNDMFTITGFGLAEDNDNQISELRVRKNFYYNGDVVFIVALYDTNNALTQVAVRTMHDNTLGVGENSISIDPINLPSDFGAVKAMVWTSLGN